MKTKRPYVSIDIETTGLDLYRSEILQIAAVFDDLVSPVGDLFTLNLKIKYHSFDYSEPYALIMNQKLITEMSDKEKSKEFVTPHEAAAKLELFIQKVFNATNKKVVLAGKNVASFDIPMLNNFLNRSGRNWHDVTEIPEHFRNLIHYKTLDVGSLYYDVFGDNVSLSEINKLTGRKEVSHDALDDALDVVYAVRHKLGLL